MLGACRSFIGCLIWQHGVIVENYLRHDNTTNCFFPLNGREPLLIWNFSVFAATISLLFFKIILKLESSPNLTKKFCDVFENCLCKIRLDCHKKLQNKFKYKLGHKPISNHSKPSSVKSRCEIFWKPILKIGTTRRASNYAAMSVHHWYPLVTNSVNQLMRPSYLSV